MKNENPVKAFIPLLLQRWLFPKSKQNRNILFFNIIAISSVLIGTIAFLLSLAILRGFESTIYHYVTTLSGHIEVTGLLGMPIEEFPDVLSYIEKQEDVAAVIPFRTGYAVVKPLRKSQYEVVFCKALAEPYSIKRTIGRYITDGDTVFSSPESREVFIGAELASRWNVRVGDSLFLLTFQAQKSSATSLLIVVVVRGIFATGSTELDNGAVYLPFDLAAEIFGYKSLEVTGFDIYLDSLEKIAAVSAELNKGLGYRFIARTMYEKFESLFSWIALQKKPIPIILSLIGFVALFNVIASLLILMVSKLHDIGILRSLGLKSQQLQQISLIIGVTLVLIGFVLGTVLTYSFAFLQNHYHIIEFRTEVHQFYQITIQPSFFDVAVSGLFLILISLLIILIPARIVSFIPPLQALRYQ